MKFRHYEIVFRYARASVATKLSRALVSVATISNGIGLTDTHFPKVPFLLESPSTSCLNHTILRT